MSAPEILFCPLPHFDAALGLPVRASAGAAGMDLRASLLPDDRWAGLVLPPMGRAAIPTGLRIAVPDGHEAQVRPRSGLAARHGITVANAPGTIDSDYRGELMVLLINLGTQAYRLSHGERMAQLVLAPVIIPACRMVADLPETGRGSGGFGSTGTT